MKKLQITLDVSNDIDINELVSSLEIKQGAHITDIQFVESESELVGEFLMYNMSQQYKIGAIVKMVRGEDEDDHSQLLEQLHSCCKHMGTGVLHSIDPELFILNSPNSLEYSKEHGKYSIKPDCAIIPHRSYQWAYNNIEAININRYLKKITIYETHEGLLGVVGEVDLADMVKMKHLRLTNRVKKAIHSGQSTDSVPYLKDCFNYMGVGTGFDRVFEEAIELTSLFVSSEPDLDSDVIIDLFSLIGERVRELMPYYNLHDLIGSDICGEHIDIYFGMMKGMGMLTPEDIELYTRVDIRDHPTLECDLLRNKIVNIGCAYHTMNDIATSFYKFEPELISAHALKLMNDILINILTIVDDNVELYECIEEVDRHYKEDFATMKKVMLDYAELNIISPKSTGYICREMMVELIKMDEFIKDIDRTKYPKLRRFIMENKLTK